MFVKKSFIQKATTFFLYNFFNKLENNGNANFDQNGKKVFIDNLFKNFEKNIVFNIGAYLNSNFIDYIQFEYGGADLDSHKGLKVRDYKPYMGNFQYSNYVAISNRIYDK